MDEELLNLVNKQVQQAISDALNCLTQMTSSTAQNSPSNRSIKPNAPLRCRSTGDNRKVPFRSAISSGSLPATENELIYYQSSRQTTNNNGPNRTFDVQYSYSLNKPWITEINKRQNNLISIQNFVNQFIEHSIQTALLEVHHQNLTNDHILTDEDDYASEPFNSYIDQFIHSTIEQTLEIISSSYIEHLSNCITDDIIAGALSAIADDEIDFQKTRKDSIELENPEQQIRYHPSELFRSLTHNSSSNEESIDSLVNNIAQQIYINSFNELKKIFANDDNSN